jgi:hypothetical protein
MIRLCPTYNLCDNKDKAGEEAKKKVEEDAAGRTSPVSASVQLGSTEEEETLSDKKRRKKEKFTRKRMTLLRKRENCWRRQSQS